MPGKSDTIVAQATPIGRGGIAVLRISGAEVTNLMLALWGRKLIPRQATYLSFPDERGRTLDVGIAIFFPQPHSFTGEDVLEFQGHGGPIVVDLILQRFLSLGARLARPGEFSERAFLHGKMDLAQAEAVADIINACSQQAARSAMRSLAGEFSRHIRAINEQIIHLRMYLEAAIDFVEEEIDFLSDKKIANDLQTITNNLTVLQQNAQQGCLLREGLTAVIAGEPNVGKSSLLNCLSEKEVAIVTDIPGTTRDLLRQTILIDGMPMHIVDTAGLRASDDVIEQEGIRRAQEEIAHADMVLYLLDATSELKGPSPAILSNESSKHYVYIRNKIDLNDENPTLAECKDRTIISLSAKTGAGMDLLKEYIKKQMGYEASNEGIYLARRRHLDALARTASLVQQAWQQLMQSQFPELAAEDLRLAQAALSEITGEFTADDLLGRIFSSFCVGK